MTENFTVHLLSNVSPGLFPSNNASKFSTHLADELNLSEGEWEVGVRQIMYPTNVSPTSVDDKIHVYKYKDTYRGLLPSPPKNGKALEALGTPIDMSPPKGKKVTNVAQHMVDSVNKSKWSKGIFSLAFNVQAQKFIINIIRKDVVLWLPPNTRKYLGFRKYQHAFTGGTYWSWYPFNQKLTMPSELKIYLFDLSTLEKKKYNMSKVWMGGTIGMCYDYIMPIDFHDGKERDDSNTHFAVYPEMGNITMDNYLPRGLEGKEKKIAFFHFSSAVTGMLNWNTIYCLDDFQSDANGSRLSLVTDQYDGKSKLLIDQLTLTVYYAAASDFSRDLEATPTASMSIKSERPIEDPQAMLPLLNEKSKTYGFSFSYNEEKRFEVSIGRDYAISLSKSLATILGFDDDKILHYDSIHRAKDFPMIKRGITALYVYSNIVDAVYIGDVKAPLLLTCPFQKTDDFNIVHQQEFLNPCYVPLNRSRINQIDIAIYDDAGSLIPFLFGKTKLSLDFRRKR